VNAWSSFIFTASVCVYIYVQTLMSVQLSMVVSDVHLRQRSVSIRLVRIDVTVLMAFTGEVANVKQKSVSDQNSLQL